MYAPSKDTLRFTVFVEIRAYSSSAANVLSPVLEAVSRGGAQAMLSNTRQHKSAT